MVVHEGDAHAGGDSPRTYSSTDALRPTVHHQPSACRQRPGARRRARRPPPPQDHPRPPAAMPTDTPRWPASNSPTDPPAPVRELPTPAVDDASPTRWPHARSTSQSTNSRRRASQVLNESEAKALMRARPAATQPWFSPAGGGVGWICAISSRLSCRRGAEADGRAPGLVGAVGEPSDRRLMQGVAAHDAGPAVRDRLGADANLPPLALQGKLTTRRHPHPGRSIRAAVQPDQGCVLDQLRGPARPVMPIESVLRLWCFLSCGALAPVTVPVLWSADRGAQPFEFWRLAGRALTAG